VNWLHTLWFGYWYPSIKGNGPEDFLGFLLLGGGVVWLGKWVLKEWRAHKAHVHAKLDHLIIHSDAPNEVAGVPDHLQPKP
jgi:hypothetical protein